MPAVYSEKLFKLYLYNEKNQRHHKPHVHLSVHNKECVLMLDDLQAIDEALKKIVTKAERIRILTVIITYREQLIDMFNNPNPNGAFERLKPLQEVVLDDDDSDILSEHQLDDDTPYETLCDDDDILSENHYDDDFCDDDRLRIVAIEPQDDYTMLIHDSDGNLRIFDFWPVIIHETWCNPLKDLRYFKSARLKKSRPQSIYWGNFDIDIYGGDILEDSEIIHV